jgi:hypothetical protein
MTRVRAATALTVPGRALIPPCTAALRHSPQALFTILPRLPVSASCLLTQWQMARSEPQAQVGPTATAANVRGVADPLCGSTGRRAGSTGAGRQAFLSPGRGLA